MYKLTIWCNSCGNHAEYLDDTHVLSVTRKEIIMKNISSDTCWMCKKPIKDNVSYKIEEQIDD